MEQIQNALICDWYWNDNYFNPERNDYYCDICGNEIDYDDYCEYEGLCENCYLEKRRTNEHI